MSATVIDSSAGVIGVFDSEADAREVARHGQSIHVREEETRIEEQRGRGSRLESVRDQLAARGVVGARSMGRSFPAVDDVILVDWGDDLRGVERDLKDALTAIRCTLAVRELPEAARAIDALNRLLEQIIERRLELA